MVRLMVNEVMLDRHVKHVPEAAYDIMDLLTKPTIMVYDNPIGIAQNLVASDNTLALRIATDKFCQYPIDKFGKPIVSPSANISGFSTPNSFRTIDHHILAGVDYAVNLQREKIMATPSSIIKPSSDGTVKVIRA